MSQQFFSVPGPGRKRADGTRSIPSAAVVGDNTGNALTGGPLLAASVTSHSDVAHTDTKAQDAKRRKTGASSARGKGKAASTKKVQLRKDAARPTKVGARSPEEHRRYQEAVSVLGANQWPAIARHVGTRDASQARASESASHLHDPPPPSRRSLAPPALSPSPPPPPLALAAFPQHKLDQTTSTAAAGSTRSPRTCRRCKGHGKTVSSTGHGVCEFAECKCWSCRKVEALREQAYRRTSRCRGQTTSTGLAHRLALFSVSARARERKELAGLRAENEHLRARLRVAVVDVSREDRSTVITSEMMERGPTAGEGAGDGGGRGALHQIHRVKQESNAQRSRADALQIDMTQLEDTSLCALCLEIPKCVLLLPCRHLCVCAGCAPRVPTGGPCPVCRTPVQVQMETFI